MNPAASLSDLVAELAQEAGFAATGIAAVPDPASPEDYAELQNVEPWLASGRAGEMEYLKRRDEAGRLLRSSLRVALPWARSVIVCAANYNSGAPNSTEPAPSSRGWIARYAWTGKPSGDGQVRPSDYHKVLLHRLRSMETKLKDLYGDFQSRCYVDTGPIVERIYAKYAGIGWIGKNTCILNEQLGSWLFLGVIATSIEVSPASIAAVPEDRCGSCRRCIEACPTGALTDAYRMDASLCISYLTIEKRGEIPEQLRAQIGRQIFGCDICQDVCPWNRRAPLGRDVELSTRADLVNPALDWLAAIDESGFANLFHGSPVTRTKLSGLRRNVAIAMGNSRLRSFLPKLQEWSQAADTVLAATAAWAITQIESQPSTDGL
ncbi:Epoxyqueuosine (oQ) reductase QueG [Acidisarcina polymorpha]|uniref:Epoxyqueuosine (OQ) reductase QueG n=1 Tax=Acidisarcina polymorpha TaxID=2211140 RepID=A0A2Z5FTB5_9BACT|nr:tRNA epoxyqueuosine(34) reductase QueG [Acidisarcina polymorpha]AXC09737.1 Epoxyqueuosine (oQ) reductase QueG [Acidisarcina polymorpha]